MRSKSLCSPNTCAALQIRKRCTQCARTIAPARASICSTTRRISVPSSPVRHWCSGVCTARCIDCSMCWTPGGRVRRERREKRCRRVIGCRKNVHKSWRRLWWSSSLRIGTDCRLSSTYSLLTNAVWISQGTCNAIVEICRCRSRVGGYCCFGKIRERYDCPTRARQSVRAREHPALSPAALRQDQGRALQAGAARRDGRAAQGDRCDREESRGADLREHDRRDGALGRAVDACQQRVRQPDVFEYESAARRAADGDVAEALCA